MKRLEIKINREPISATIPFAWEVELLTETNHIDLLEQMTVTQTYYRTKNRQRIKTLQFYPSEVMVYLNESLNLDDTKKKTCNK